MWPVEMLESRRRHSTAGHTSFVDQRSRALSPDIFEYPPGGAVGESESDVDGGDLHFEFLLDPSTAAELERAQAALAHLAADGGAAATDAAD
jgi:hypothetical protein